MGEEKFLEKAPLTEEDKKLWREMLAKMPPEDKEQLFSLIAENDKFWAFFNENLKSKMEAIKKGDKAWFSWIVSKEKEFLDQID